MAEASPVSTGGRHRRGSFVQYEDAAAAYKAHVVAEGALAGGSPLVPAGTPEGSAPPEQQSLGGSRSSRRRRGSFVNYADVAEAYQRSQSLERSQEGAEHGSSGGPPGPCSAGPASGAAAPQLSPADAAAASGGRRRRGSYVKYEDVNNAFLRASSGGTPGGDVSASASATPAAFAAAGAPPSYSPSSQEVAGRQLEARFADATPSGTSPAQPGTVSRSGSRRRRGSYVYQEPTAQASETGMPQALGSAGAGTAGVAVAGRDGAAPLYRHNSLGGSSAASEASDARSPLGVVTAAAAGAAAQDHHHHQQQQQQQEMASLEQRFAATVLGQPIEQPPIVDSSDEEQVSESDVVSYPAMQLLLPAGATASLDSSGAAEQVQPSASSWLQPDAAAEPATLSGPGPILRTSGSGLPASSAVKLLPVSSYKRMPSFPRESSELSPAQRPSADGRHPVMAVPALVPSPATDMQALSLTSPAHTSPFAARPPLPPQAQPPRALDGGAASTSSGIDDDVENDAGLQRTTSLVIQPASPSDTQQPAPRRFKPTPSFSKNEAAAPAEAGELQGAAVAPLSTSGGCKPAAAGAGGGQKEDDEGEGGRGGIGGGNGGGGGPAGQASAAAGGTGAASDGRSGNGSAGSGQPADGFSLSQSLSRQVEMEIQAVQEAGGAVGHAGEDDALLHRTLGGGQGSAERRERDAEREREGIAGDKAGDMAGDMLVPVDAIHRSLDPLGDRPPASDFDLAVQIEQATWGFDRRWDRILRARMLGRDSMDKGSDAMSSSQRTTASGQAPITYPLLDSQSQSTLQEGGSASSSAQGSSKRSSLQGGAQEEAEVGTPAAGIPAAEEEGEAAAPPLLQAAVAEPAAVLHPEPGPDAAAATGAAWPAAASVAAVATGEPLTSPVAMAAISSFFTSTEPPPAAVQAPDPTTATAEAPAAMTAVAADSVDEAAASTHKPAADAAAAPAAAVSALPESQAAAAAEEEEPEMSEASEESELSASSSAAEHSAAAAAEHTAPPADATATAAINPAATPLPSPSSTQPLSPTTVQSAAPTQQHQQQQPPPPVNAPAEYTHTSGEGAHLQADAHADSHGRTLHPWAHAGAVAAVARGYMALPLYEVPAGSVVVVSPQPAASPPLSAPSSPAAGAASPQGSPQTALRPQPLRTARMLALPAGQAPPAASSPDSWRQLLRPVQQVGSNTAAEQLSPMEAPAAVSPPAAAAAPALALDPLLSHLRSLSLETQKAIVQHLGSSIEEQASNVQSPSTSNGGGRSHKSGRSNAAGSPTREAASQTEAALQQQQRAAATTTRAADAVASMLRAGAAEAPAWADAADSSVPSASPVPSAKPSAIASPSYSMGSRSNGHGGYTNGGGGYINGGGYSGGSGGAVMDQFEWWHTAMTPATPRSISSTGSTPLAYKDWASQAARKQAAAFMAASPAASSGGSRVSKILVRSHPLPDEANAPLVR